MLFYEKKAKASETHSKKCQFNEHQCKMDVYCFLQPGSFLAPGIGQSSFLPSAKDPQPTIVGIVSKHVDSVRNTLRQPICLAVSFTCQLQILHARGNGVIVIVKGSVMSQRIGLEIRSPFQRLSLMAPLNALNSVVPGRMLDVLRVMNRSRSVR